MALNRRDFLRYSAAGFALGIFSSPLNRIPFLRRSLQAASYGPPNKKLIILFQRGGWTGSTR